MKIWMLVGLLFSSEAFAQDVSWKAGLSSGYVIQNQLLAVPLDHAFPISGFVELIWKNKWHASLVYEWIRTGQFPGETATIQSFQFLPGIDLWKSSRHRFTFETGPGYQYADLQPIDIITQVQWIVGPRWSWNIEEKIHVETAIRFSESIDSHFQANLSQWNMLLGLSYHFDFQPQRPVARGNDADQDGIEDARDECLSTPFGVVVSKKGCPLDSDSDGVTDSNDFCTETHREAEVDDLGCPLTNPGRGMLSDVEFENDSPRLTEISKNTLMIVAENLKKFPNLFFRVEGYSSSEQFPGFNMSDARARSVMNILISYGVPSNRISAIGYREQYPLVDSSSSNQQLNDRIEIKWNSAP